MNDRGHLARSRALELPMNRTLVRDVVRLLLIDHHAPAYVVYDRNRRKLMATAARPVNGVWRQVGPYNIADITLLTLAQEIEFVAQECRRAANTG